MYDYYVEEDENPLFYFITKNNNTYAVEFFKHNIDNDYIYEVYELSFNVVEEYSKRNDLYVSSTIIKIVVDFFYNNPNAVIFYICDSNDNRQVFRNRLFNRWFLKSNKDEIYSKLNLNYTGADFNYKLELLFFSEKYNFDKIIESVSKELEILSGYK
ncbi:DUF6169 family protein [Psychroflexus sp. MBR-150]|jgi:hypothetical protein